MLKRFLVVFVFVLFSENIPASVIPQYQLSSIDHSTITFTNQAEFLVGTFNWWRLSEWDSGDQLKIVSHFFPVFPPAFEKPGAITMIFPTFCIKNLTKGSQVEAHLITLPQVGSLRIVSVDAQAGQVVLSDSSVWNIFPEDKRFLFFWDVNDFILIGQNTDPRSPSYDAILFNASKQNFAEAVGL